MSDWDLDSLGHQALQVTIIGGLVHGVFRYILIPAYTWIKGANELITAVLEFSDTVSKINITLKHFDERLESLENKRRPPTPSEADDSEF